MSQLFKLVISVINEASLVCLWILSAEDWCTGRIKQLQASRNEKAKII
jgi:hypothetical protein